MSYINTDISYIKMQKEFSEKEIRELNQYLYDNSINLSKSQKTLFIASVLICFKIDDKILNGYDESTNSFLIADRMINIIDEYFSDSLFTNNFNFIKKSIHNKHLYHIFNLISFDIKKYGKDILNQFYSEFCIWDRNNDGKLGIVLTPDDIVNIMVDKSFEWYCEVNGIKDKINELSKVKVIDFCTGTGSFLIKSSKYTKLLYGCECGDERYSLAKCNFILNDLDYVNLKYNSCFNESYSPDYFDISIINPPFNNKCKDELNPNNITNWKSLTKEQRFIMYQVMLLRVNGIGCCIVPRSNFNNNTKNVNNFKHEFMKYVKILSYYKCNSKVFMPNASVECVIIIYQKINKLDNPIESEDVEIINYFDDGYKLKKNIRVKYSEPNLLVSNKTLKWDDDFNDNDEDNNYPDIKKLLKLNEIDKFYYEMKNTLNSNLIMKLYDKVTNIDKLNIIKWNKIKISDYFEIIKVKPLKISECEDGEYPLISSSKVNNGICKYINKYLVEGEFISVARNGSVGYSFYQSNKFSITTDIILLKPLKEIDYHLIAILLTECLHSKYSYSNKLTNQKLMNEIINVPIFG